MLNRLFYVTDADNPGRPFLDIHLGTWEQCDNSIKKGITDGIIHPVILPFIGKFHCLLVSNNGKQPKDYFYGEGNQEPNARIARYRKDRTRSPDA